MLAAAEVTQSPGNLLRMLCTAPPGSIPDIVARRYAEGLAGQSGGSVVVDNRPGAAGRIAVAALKQSAPDGATMLLAQGAVATVYPYLYEKLAYDARTDLKPVALAAEATLALAVGPAVPDSVVSLGQFIEWTRAHPDLANYGSPGLGTLPHLLTALLAREANVDWRHVAYSGGPTALVDLLGGRIAFLILPEGLLRQHQSAGGLRVLATSGAARSAFMPGVASFAEQGYPNLVVREWFALFMPGGTPQPLVDGVAQRVRQAAAGGSVPQALAEMGMLAVASTSAELGDRIALEQRYWQRVLSATAIRIES
jgi:tripartite-type tricarboxylate transporter receptor subunit TctC